jgi:small-conductance mechanosensitive channel
MAESGYGRGYGKLGIARFYALVFGIAYLGVAILELFYPESDPLAIGDTVVLQRTVLQNVVHFAVGVVVLGSFFAGDSAARIVARVIGVVFVALTVYGFLAPDSLGDLLGYDGDIPPMYNYIHAVTAILALFAGFAGRRTTAAA